MRRLQTLDHILHVFGRGRDIWRSDVIIRPYDIGKKLAISDGELAALLTRQSACVNAHSALGAAERQVEKGAFKGHQKAKAIDFIRRGGGRKPHTALCRPLERIVAATPCPGKTRLSLICAKHELALYQFARKRQKAFDFPEIRVCLDQAIKTGHGLLQQVRHSDLLAGASSRGRGLLCGHGL